MLSCGRMSRQPQQPSGARQGERPAAAAACGARQLLQEPAQLHQLQHRGKHSAAVNTSHVLASKKNQSS